MTQGTEVAVRAFAFVLFLLPVILLGALACGAEEAEPTATVTPTRAAQAEATAGPEATTSDAAPETAVPTALPPTEAPTATAAPEAPTEHAPEPTEAPGQMYTPTPAPTEAPEPTALVSTNVPEPTIAENGTGPGSYTVGEGSEITFTVEEELNRTPVRFDAVISGTGLTGFANLDGSPSVITLDLHSLESDQSFRDRFIRDRMFPNTPVATVTFGQLPDLPQSFLDGEETEGTLEGSLQIGDTVTPLTFDVVARLDPGVINVLGSSTFTWEAAGAGQAGFRPRGIPGRRGPRPSADRGAGAVGYFHHRRVPVILRAYLNSPPR